MHNSDQDLCAKDSIGHASFKYYLCITFDWVRLNNTNSPLDLLRLQLLGFDWKNCGKEDDPAVLKSLSLSPDPISIPGDVSASASGSTAVELSAPLSVGTTQQKIVN